jgi:hypothetical protein
LLVLLFLIGEKMGALLTEGEARFTAGSLNDMFGSANIAATFAKIEELRKTFPHLLNPANNPGPKAARRQTLRFAAFLLTDELLFNGTYPAPRLRAWLKWLTWLGGHQGGTRTLNGAAFNGTGSQLVLNVLSQALPPGGQPSPVRFSWTHNTNVNQFTVAGNTNAGFSIDVVSPQHSEVNANGDDEDDINP